MAFSNIITAIGFVLASALLGTGCSSCRQSRAVLLGDGKERGAWRDIEYSEKVETCKVNFNVEDVDRHFLRRVAECYPNLKVLLVQEELHYDEAISVDLDCSEMRSATNVVIAEITNLAGQIKNFEDFCRDSRKRYVRIYSTPGESLFHHQRICHLPDAEPKDEIDDFISGLGKDCDVKIEEGCGIYSENDRLRRLVLDNKGNELIVLQEIPSSCNHVILHGGFDLSGVETCGQVNALSWIYNGWDFQKNIAEITPERFPNLRFLQLIIDAEKVCEIDVSSLSGFSGMKAFDFVLRNVIPIGENDLYKIEGLWGVLNSCCLYRLDNGVELDPNMEFWPGYDYDSEIESAMGR